MQSCGIVRIYHREPYCLDDGQCGCNESQGKYLKMEYFQNNGIKEGSYKKYYRNGKLMEECNYIDGKIRGIHKLYGRDGGLLRQIYL